MLFILLHLLAVKWYGDPIPLFVISARYFACFRMSWLHESERNTFLRKVSLTLRFTCITTAPSMLKAKGKFAQKRCHFIQWQWWDSVSVNAIKVSKSCTSSQKLISDLNYARRPIVKRVTTIFTFYPTNDALQTITGDPHKNWVLIHYSNYQCIRFFKKRNC